MIETANMKTNTRLSDAELDRVVDRMFVLAGMDGKSSLKLEDFHTLFHKNGNLLQDVSIDWKGMAFLFVTKVMTPEGNGTRLDMSEALPEMLKSRAVQLCFCSRPSSPDVQFESVSFFSADSFK